MCKVVESRGRIRSRSRHRNYIAASGRLTYNPQGEFARALQGALSGGRRRSRREKQDGAVMQERGFPGRQNNKQQCQDTHEISPWSTRSLPTES